MSKNRIKDKNKSKEQLIREPAKMRRRISRLETSADRQKQAEKELLLLYDSIDDLITIQDTNYKILHYNGAVEKRFGKDLKGKLCYEVYQSRKEICPDCAVKKVIETKKPAFTFQPATAVSQPVEIYAYPVFNKKGDVTAVIEQGKDVTEKLNMQERIILAKKEWEETFDVINESITIHDRDFNIIRANKAAEKMLGLPFLKILSQKCYESYHGTDCPPERCPSCRTLKTGVPSVTEMFEPKLNKYLEIKALPRLDKDNNLIGLVHIVRDITQQKRLEEELRALSLTDELTGLYNRRGFFTLAEQQLKIANRLGKGVLILYADLTGLKLINDTFGHAEGDRALIGVAGLLKEVFRESDIIARIGGDEFVVFPIEVANTNASTLNARFQKKLKSFNMKKDRKYEMKISIGIVQYEKECPCSIEELLIQADTEMYKHKKTNS